MNKKLQVFVSSTYADLIEERQAAVEVILDAGHIPAGMELFKAGKSQMKTIQKWIDDSDVYMLILGGRYGSIEEESGLSYTELEYRYALSKNMPVFAIVLEESFLYTKVASESKEAILEKDNIDKYNNFKNYVKTKVVRFVTNIDQISSTVHAQLNHIVNDPEYSLIGWTRIDASYSMLDHINKHINKDVLNRCNDISTILSNKISQMLSFTNAISHFKRIINLCFMNDDTIKIEITDRIKYIHHSNSFQVLFDATKQQAESFSVNKLEINNKDHITDCKIHIQSLKENEKFGYQIYSDKVYVDEPIQRINYSCTYLSSIEDFFMSRRFHSPCKACNIIVTLDDPNNRYSILCALFSSFEKIQHNDFNDYEWQNDKLCEIELPTWSLPGSGYVITLRKI